MSSNSLLFFQIKADIVDDGHTLVKRAGFVWSDVNTMPTLQDNQKECVINNLQIQLQINWPVNTQFYVRAFVENSIGLFYSTSFLVSWPGGPANLPIVQTINPNNIGFFECLIDGYIQSNGGPPITEKGFCFSSINQSPTILNDVMLNNTVGSVFSNLIPNLDENATYYFRAYAKNLQGIGYGEVIAITTSNYLYPGELGSYGGLIFYSKIDTVGGWNFLEAAPNDCNGNLMWSNNNSSITTSNNLGTSMQNTLNIIQFMGFTNPPYAAIAAYYYPNGLAGWSLPSRNELGEMRKNLYLNQLGNFMADAKYWSSSQDTTFSENAWTVKMTNDSSNTASYVKSNQYKIRAIRRY